jgi:hypothetical protein
MTLTLPWFALLIPLLLVGVHRATRIVTRDKIPLIAVPRENFVNRWGTYEDEPDDTAAQRAEKRRTSIGGQHTNRFMASIAYLWECDWCASIWIGSGLTYATWRWPETMVWILLALTASTVTGLLAKVEAK